MKSRLTKLITFFMIFLLCFNIYNFMSMSLNDGKATSITDQTESFLNTSNGADPFTLRVGKRYGPDTLEPVDSWDSATNDVLEQVVETLFFYDLTDENLPRINLLAQSYYWVDTTHLQIQLREGILFHDGTPFDASAAKWNLDRLLYLTNCTGTNTGTVAKTQSLWMFVDGVTPLINNVVTVGTYNISITLNGPYAPFLSTLSYINAGMISPTAHAADAETFIDRATGILIGTGPFRYEYYDTGNEVKFTRWDDYWKGPAYFEEMLYVIFNDYSTAHNAMLAYEIDILDMIAQQNLPLYDADPNIIVNRFSEDTGKIGLIYQYMGFNNHKYNLTWRQAMAYAINYTYVLEELLEGNAIRANSPISPGFGGAYNASVVGPTYNVAKARTLMQSMGFGVGFTTDAEWNAVAESATPFLSVLHTYNIGNQFREDFHVAITVWFKLIGINVVDDGVVAETFFNYLYYDKDHLGIYSIGWGPDYLDPYNMIDPLFNPTSISNSAQVNDPWLNAQLALALETIDEITRNTIYQNIQSYLARMQFHATLYHNILTYVHLKEIKGVPYNAMDSFYAYPIYRAFTLYDTIPDEVTMTYTRTPQIIGSFSAYSSSKIISVGWLGEPDPGFALFTTYSDDENGGIYLSETTIMTTNQLEPGIHLLNLRIWDVDGDFYDKSFAVIVYRQAQLNLRGEFDYLLKENIKISIVAQAFDVEDQFLLNPIAIEGMIVHIKIVDYDGNVKVEDTMTYDSNGFFHWDSVQTIAKLKDIFTKGIYIVQAWIEFPPESYYLGGTDVIEFHIDPPAEDEVDVWFFIEVVGFSGLIGVVLTLTILLKRKRSIK